MRPFSFFTRSEVFKRPAVRAGYAKGILVSVARRLVGLRKRPPEVHPVELPRPFGIERTALSGGVEEPVDFAFREGVGDADDGHFAPRRRLGFLEDPPILLRDWRRARRFRTET